MVDTIAEFSVLLSRKDKMTTQPKVIIMNVKTLREMLAQFDDAAEVKFAYAFGDYCRTTVACTISCVDELAVEYSDYHRMHKVLNDDEDWDDKKIVVVLS